MESPLEGSRIYESPDDRGGSGATEKERGDKAREDMEARYGQAREEDYAKRDRVLNRLMSAEKPRDVAAALEVIKDYENVEYGESIDRFTYSAYKRAAVEGQRAFEKGSKDLRELKDLGIVSEDAEIDSDGDLVKGKVRASGYAIGVREVRGEEKPHTITKVRYTVDPQTGKRGTPEVVEETESNGMPKEVVHFGTAAERLALARAHEELHKILITSEILQNQTELFDKTRAALEMAVKYFYNDQLYFTNRQTKWFFTAADIRKMDHTKPETLKNTELGDRRDKAMRLYYLVGMSETRDKMLEHLNTTFNLEKILDYDNGENTETIDRVLKLAGIEGLVDKDEKFKAAAKFLISKDLVVTKQPDGTWKYDLPTWLTGEQRDPLKDVKKPKTIGKGEYKKGSGAVEDETKEGVRGFLTSLGNPYIEGSRDNLYMLMNKMSLIVRDEMAVTEAGRYFWTRGMRDELGMEVYSFKQNDRGEWVPNLPTGEYLLEQKNTLPFKSEDPKVEDWDKYCAKIRKCYAIPGEPVGSDLSKLFHTKMWRLKEMMLDRSAGPYLTYDRFEHLTQSLLSLCRIRVETREKDAYGKQVTEFRSIREAWLGHKSDGSIQDKEENALDLGGLEWEQAKMPADLQEFLTGGGAELVAVDINGKELKIDLKAVTDNNEGYFWVMNYLAGDDNINKRPWQFIMKGVERPGDLQKPEAYTDKIKFWKIIWHGPATVWGKWGELYRHTREKVAKENEEALGKDPAAKVKGPEDVVEEAENAADENAARMLEKAKKDWYSGLRSMPDYPTWATEKVSFAGWIDGVVKSGTIDLIDVVEGVNRNKPGLAVRYGFMNIDDIAKPPKHQMKYFA